MLPASALTSVSPIDGRYAAKTTALREFFSEYALIRERVSIEVAWFSHLADEPGVAELTPLDSALRRDVLAIAEQFSVDEAKTVKGIEAVSYTHLTLPTTPYV